MAQNHLLMLICPAARHKHVAGDGLCRQCTILILLLLRILLMAHHHITALVVHISVKLLSSEVTPGMASITRHFSLAGCSFHDGSLSVGLLAICAISRCLRRQVMSRANT